MEWNVVYVWIEAKIACIFTANDIKNKYSQS